MPTPTPKPSPKPLVISTIVYPPKDIPKAEYLEKYADNEWMIIEVDRDPKPILLMMTHGQELRFVAGQVSQCEMNAEADSTAHTPSSNYKPNQGGGP